MHLKKFHTIDEILASNTAGGNNTSLTTEQIEDAVVDINKLIKDKKSQMKTLLFGG